MRWLALLAALGASGCLQPFDEGELAPSPVLLGEIGGRVQATGRPFTTRAVRISAYQADQVVHIGRLDGEVSEIVPPVWRLFGPEGPLDAPIVDVLPGDTGYGPIWRLHQVRVTDRYAGEAIRSRADVDAAIALGLVEPPVPTETLLLAPICVDEPSIEGWPAPVPAPVDVWYRGQAVAWLRIPTALDLPSETQQIIPRAAFVLQRVNQPHPLDEDLAGFDLDGDGQRFSSHRVLEDVASPLCRVRQARTAATLSSIDDPDPDQLTSSDDPAFAPADPVLGFEGSATLEFCPGVDG